MLDPWQKLLLDVAMSERTDDFWAAGEVGLIASRQNGKNGAVEARELFGLTVLNEWIIHTSHLFKTTKESYNRLLGLIEANRDVRNCMTFNVASPASGYEMRFRGGGRINFIARSRTSGRGLTGDLLIFDEAQDLDDDAQGALLPTVSARPGAQSWYLGSAPGLESTVFQRVRRRGRGGTEPRLAYLEFSADPDSHLDDREAWAQANPALGDRITEEAVEAERASMSDEMFARERLSISPDIEIGTNRVISAQSWAACLDPASTTVGRVSFALDVSPERDSGAIATAGESTLGGTHVEITGSDGITDHRAGTDWLVPRAKQLQGAWGGLVAVSAGSPAASLLPELEAAGVEVVVIKNSDHALACGAFFDAIAQSQLHHLGQSGLSAAVDGAERKFYGDAWLWSRRSSAVDISPLVAVTLAKWVHDQVPAPAADFYMI